MIEIRNIIDIWMQIKLISLIRLMVSLNDYTRIMILNTRYVLPDGVVTELRGMIFHHQKRNISSMRNHRLTTDWRNLLSPTTIVSACPNRPIKRFGKVKVISSHHLDWDCPKPVSSTSWLCEGVISVTKGLLRSEKSSFYEIDNLFEERISNRLHAINKKRWCPTINLFLFEILDLCPYSLGS